MPNLNVGASSESTVPAMDLLAVQTASGSSDTLTFSNIPQTTYNDLYLKFIIRTTETAGAENTQHAFVRPNADSTAANYGFQEMRGLGSTPAGVELIGFEALPAVGPEDDGPSGSYGYGECTILGYRQTTFHKPIIGKMGGRFKTTTGYIGALSQVSFWCSTAAITSLTVLAEDGNWKAGTVVSLYGVR